MYTRNVKVLAAAALFCLLLPAAAFAKDPDGIWKGTLKRENLNTVDAEVRFSGKDSTVHFASPYRCSVPIARNADQGSLSYTFGTSNGGGMFCQGLKDAKLELAQSPDGKTLVASFTTTGTLGRGKWSGKLVQAGSTKP